MSAVGDVLAGIRKMLLIEETVGRIDKDMATLTDDLRALRRDHVTLGNRVSEIEGYLRAATRTPFGDKPRLSGE